MTEFTLVVHKIVDILEAQVAENSIQVAGKVLGHRWGCWWVPVGRRWRPPAGRRQNSVRACSVRCPVHYYTMLLQPTGSLWEMPDSNPGPLPQKSGALLFKLYLSDFPRNFWPGCSCWRASRLHLVTWPSAPCWTWGSTAYRSTTSTTPTSGTGYTHS